MSTAKRFIWYLALVQGVVALDGCPGAGVGTFQSGQNVYVRPLLHGKWMLYDGDDLYTILTKEQAQAALKSCRDAQGKVLLAEHQEKLTMQFFLAVERHGTGFACRPRY
jgi:hypothetical protein